MSEVTLTFDPYMVVKETIDTEVDDLAFTYAKSICAPEGIELGSDAFIDMYTTVKDVYRAGGDRLVYFMHMSLITICTILEGNGLFINIPANLSDEESAKTIENHILESARCVSAALMHLYATDIESLPVNDEFARVPAEARSVSFTFSRKGSNA